MFIPVHLIDSYEPYEAKYEFLVGRKTEVQLQTRLQHAWATAVETVDSILGQHLKTGGGDADWKRFFALASGHIAYKEECPCVPGTPSSSSALRAELKTLAESLKVVTKLEGMSAGVEVINSVPHSGQNTGKHKILEYIFVLDVQQKRIKPYGYTLATLSSIADDYLAFEKANFGDPNIQIVQVKVGTARDLKRAYPNYYLSAQSFLSVVKEVL